MKSGRNIEGDKYHLCSSMPMPILRFVGVGNYSIKNFLDRPCGNDLVFSIKNN